MLRTLIQDFINEKRLKKEIYHIVLDNKAHIVHQGISKTNTPAFNIFGDFALTNMKDLHMVRNMGLRDDTGHVTQHTMKQYNGCEDVYATFGDWDINYMLYRNKDDEYIFNAYSLVSPNGTILTMLRCSDFDEELFRETYSNYVEKNKKFIKDKQKGDLEDYSYSFTDCLRFKEAGIELLQDRGETILWDMIH